MEVSISEQPQLTLSRSIKEMRQGNATLKKCGEEMQNFLSTPTSITEKKPTRN